LSFGSARSPSNEITLPLYDALEFQALALTKDEILEYDEL
jgi:hypothetical protein